ncbi:hypothetical protein F5Y05DRAFT_123026 [Hypoxylon sp. FL0543]|nr:hypothetical protein F5Y05DRAFT_123026 [Hypoxylon sp. FL0543]
MATITPASSGHSCFLLKVPLHVIAGILGELDTVRQLVPAIQSHSIFRDALKQNFHSIARSITVAKIPLEILPFAIALLESTQIDPTDYEAVQGLITRLATASSTSTDEPLPTAHLSLSDYDFLGQNYAAAESLAGKIAVGAIETMTMSLPLLRKSPEVTPEENYRIVRALFRYQLMCNLFCLDWEAEEVNEELKDIPRYLFFNMFSPWVNEQLMCVYAYLERKVGYALDYLVAHDEQWARCPITWDEEPDVCPYIQSFLCRGLPFLSQVACATTYDERLRLPAWDWPPNVEWDFTPLRQLIYMVPEESLVQSLGLDDKDTPLESYSPAQLEQMARPSDGTQDSTASNLFRLWLGAHTDTSIFESMWPDSTDRNLWDCGYVLWDYADFDDAKDLPVQCAEVRDRSSYLSRFRDTWRNEDIQRLWRLRDDIWRARAFQVGFWPGRSAGLGGVHGLSEGTKKLLLRKWQEYGLVEST